MKPGSHVIFIGVPNVRTDIPLNLPKVKTEVYTVREISMSIGDVVPVQLAFLEEIVIAIHPVLKAEIGIEPKYLREIDLPDALKEEVKESLTRELVTKN